MPNNYDLSLNTTIIPQDVRRARSCNPVPIEESCPREFRKCTDLNGCCAMFPVDCRDPFWPAFAHPRCLSCEQLYCGKSSVCCNTSPAEERRCCCCRCRCRGCC